MRGPYGYDPKSKMNALETYAKLDAKKENNLEEEIDKTLIKLKDDPFEEYTQGYLEGLLFAQAEKKKEDTKTNGDNG